MANPDINVNVTNASLPVQVSASRQEFVIWGGPANARLIVFRLSFFPRPGDYISTPIRDEGGQWKMTRYKVESANYPDHAGNAHPEVDAIVVTSAGEDYTLPH